MQLVATKNGNLFRSQSVSEEEIEISKETMLQNQEGLDFQVMADIEFEEWLMTH